MSRKVVNGSCPGCECLSKEIGKKDKIIDELQAKLETIHHLTRPLDTNTNSTNNVRDRDWSREFNFTSFNLGIGIHRKRGRSRSSSSSTESNVTRVPTKSIKLQVFQQENTGISQLGNHHHHHEVRVITVQEIIDKVVEKSPQGNELEKNRTVDNLFDIESMNFDSDGSDGMSVPGSPNGIPADVLKRIPSGTDIRMVYNIH